LPPLTIAIPGAGVSAWNSTVASSRIVMLPALLDAMAVPPVVARLPFTLVFPSSVSDAEPSSVMPPPLPSAVLSAMVLLWMLALTLF
jgi:hypothetical protein